MLRVVIIDDEETAIYLLSNFLGNLSSFEVKIIGTALNLEDGVELIKKTQPDIVFLDIKMPRRNGLEIYNEFKSPPFKIIFCSSYQQYALDVLKKSANGYLLKPVDFIELRDTLQVVSSELIQEQQKLQLEDKINLMSTPEMSGKNIMIDVENGFIIGNTRNIEYCYANQSYSVMVTYTQNEIVVTKSLKELQEILPQNQFVRTHKSYLVNIFYIRKFVHTKDSYVVLKSGIKIPVSVRITPSIKKDIEKKLLG